jgi:hypothetical protein
MNTTTKVSMSRTRRVTIEVLVPPLLATFIVAIWQGKHFADNIQQAIIGFPVFVFFAYIYGILPCIGYAALMELWFSKGFNNGHSWIYTTTLSTLFGLTAGFLIQLLIPGGFMMLMPVGGVDGFLVGLYLALRSH